LAAGVGFGASAAMLFFHIREADSLTARRMD
jgi:hypothetical protein